VLSALKAQLDPHLPSVLLSHVHVRGVNAHNLYQISESDDVVFEPSDIPTAWSYVAYGHIHCPQSVLQGADHVRYAGSVARLDAGERNDNKSVVLLDIVGNVLQGQPILLPLDSTPFYQIEITDPDNQIPHLKEQYPDADHALVKYTLHWESGKHNRDELCRQINTIFPRWYEREERKLGDNTVPTQFTAAKMRDVRGTVREYLQARLENDKDKDALLALAEELLVEEVLS
jgi:DNA repair protein SbcD/Mre11